ncbi:hypothetical protein YC2023_016272 [Brassica napus]
MLAIQAPLPLNHHHHHTGSNHRYSVPVDREIVEKVGQFESIQLLKIVMWVHPGRITALMVLEVMIVRLDKDNDVKNMFKPRCCKKRAKYETMDSKNSSNKKIILDWAEDEARRKREQDVLKKKKEQASKKCWTKLEDAGKSMA